MRGDFSTRKARRRPRRREGERPCSRNTVWEASLLTTFLDPTESAIISTMLEAGVRYHNEAVDSARREQRGPPHVHVFGAMITSLVTQITLITPQPTFVDHLRQISTRLNAATLTAVMEMVTVARLSRTRQPNQKRVQIRVNNETHAGAIKAALCTVGLRHMCGTAPSGQHERVLSKHLSGQEALT